MVMKILGDAFPSVYITNNNIMDTRIELPVRFRHDEMVKLIAKNGGWTKNHQLCEMFIVGKWRMVGMYTPKQINREQYLKDIRTKISLNVSQNDPIHSVGYNIVIKQD